MPGLTEKDIQITVQGNALTIRGKKRLSPQDEGKHYQSREIHYGDYQRTLTLSESAEIEKIKASFKKGTLWIEVLKNPTMDAPIQTIPIRE